MSGHRIPEETAAPLLANLVRKAQAGDPIAFAELVSRFEGYALRRAYGLLRDRPLAEDAVQEAFLEASLKLHQLQIPEAFPGWFSRIVFKRCDRFTRGKKLAAVALEQAMEVADGAIAADVQAATEEAHAALRDALAALPDHERPLVEAFYLAGQSQQELAEATGLPVTTIKKRLYAARQRMRKALRYVEAAAPDTEEQRGAFSPAEQLFMAAWHGFGAKAETLLAADPALATLLNTDGMGVLLFAAHASHHTGRREVIEVLLRRGAPVELHAAAALGLIERVQAIISVAPEDLDAPGPWGRTPLHWAVCAGHAPLTLWLLARGADLHRADCWGCTPLHLAADFGHEVLLSALLAHGADPGAAMKNGKRPVHLAASHRSVPILRALLQRGAALDVFAVAALGDVRRAETLLQARPEDLDATLNLGATPIHVAAECGRADMVRFLAEQGAQVDVVTAAHLGRLNEVDRLLKEAPEAVNERAGSFGFTALHYASMRGWGALARVLLSHGADTGLTDRMYLKTPLDEALYFGRADLAQLLRSHPRTAP